MHSTLYFVRDWTSRHSRIFPP